MKPSPEGLERSFAGVGVGPYLEMVGPSDFKVTGNLQDWDVMPRLPDRRAPRSS